MLSAHENEAYARKSTSKSLDQEAERDARSGKREGGAFSEAPFSPSKAHRQEEEQDQDTPAMTADKIYVGRLSPSVQKRDLEEVFEPYGRLLSVEVKYGGFAFIHFEAQADAEEAVRALDNYMLDGRKLTVQFSVKKGNAASSDCLVCGVAGHWARECPQNKDKGLDIKSGKCFKCGNAGHLARYCRFEAKSESVTGGDDRGSNRYRERSESHVAASSSAYPPRHHQHPSAPILDYHNSHHSRDYRDRDRDYVRMSHSSMSSGAAGRDRDDRSGRSAAMFDYPNRRPRSPLSPRRYASTGHSSSAAAHSSYPAHVGVGASNSNHRNVSYGSPGYEYRGQTMRRDHPAQDFDYRSYGHRYEDDGLPPPPSYRRGDMGSDIPGQYATGEIDRAGYYSSRRAVDYYDDAPPPRRDYARGNSSQQSYRVGSSHSHDYNGRRGGEFEQRR